MTHAQINIRQPDDGLAAEWKGRVWLNPPYSNVHLWMKMLIEHDDGVALVNARPETLWFQRAASHAQAALWLKRRVNFERPDAKPTHTPVGSMLLAFGSDCANALRNCGLEGLYMTIERPIKAHG